MSEREGALISSASLRRDRSTDLPQILARMTAWARAATGGDPGRIVQGYDLEGGTIGTTGGAAFLAPLGVAAMAVPDAQAWLEGMLPCVFRGGLANVGPGARVQ